MPLLKSKLYSILRNMDVEYQKLDERHRESQPKNNSIPVGGGDWMDTFFRMEALRGTMSALRSGKSIPKAIEDGKAVSEISVRIWNGRREWQVRRWVETAHAYLERTVRKCRRMKD